MYIYIDSFNSDYGPAGEEVNLHNDDYVLSVEQVTVIIVKSQFFASSGFSYQTPMC